MEALEQHVADAGATKVDEDEDEVDENGMARGRATPRRSNEL